MENYIEKIIEHINTLNSVEELKTFHICSISIKYVKCAGRGYHIYISNQLRREVCSQHSRNH